MCVVLAAGKLLLGTWLKTIPLPAPLPACLRLQLGRFTLRDEGKTIAIGKVLRVPKRGGAAQAE